jgi:hypothetical protein
LPKHLKDLVCVVDETEIRIPRLSQPIEERSTNSVKKKQHSFTLTLMFDGRLIFGSDHSITKMEKSDLVKFRSSMQSLIGDFCCNDKGKDEISFRQCFVEASQILCVKRFCTHQR